MPDKEIATLRDLRRHQIISAARALIADRGLNALTFAALEARVDFTRGVITYHFKNKDEILEAVLASVTEEINDSVRVAIREADGMDGKLRAMLGATVRGFLDKPEAGMILISFWSRIPSNRQVARVNAALYQGYRRYAAELLAAGTEKGSFRQHRPQPLAAVIVGIVIGLVTQVYFEAEAIAVDEAIDEAARAILAYLGPVAGEADGRDGFAKI